MERKSLKEISWQVTEPEYRADPALSYSNLSTFERLGFEGLDKLYDRVDTPSLQFGSMVDCLITDGEGEFHKNYMVSQIPSLEPSVEPVVKEVFEQFKNSYTDIKDIPDSSIMPIIAQFNYQQRWKPETRCNSIRDKGRQYYQTMFMAGDKKIVTQDVYNKVFSCVRALKDSPQTHDYFCEDNPFDSIERYYQLKFKDELSTLGTKSAHVYRCMMDLAIVNHDKKVVIPCDLKTSSPREYNFPRNFIDYHYQLQARLYWRLLRKAMDKDDYYKDFRLADYRFIVVNSIDNPNPLVWGFDKTQAVGNIIINDVVLRDPEDIGNELYYYLENKPRVPVGIKEKGINDITDWIIRHGR